jgi:anti-sigma B factor antagonist
VPADDRLGIEVSSDGGTVVIALLGELDLASACTFSAKFEQAAAGGPAAIVVDLSELEFIDSTGLRCILLAHERCDGRGPRFAVVPGDGQAARLLEIARVEDHLNLIASPAELSV